VPQYVIVASFQRGSEVFSGPDTSTMPRLWFAASASAKLVCAVTRPEKVPAIFALSLPPIFCD